MKTEVRWIYKSHDLNSHNIYYMLLLSLEIEQTSSHYWDPKTLSASAGEKLNKDVCFHFTFKIHKND